MKFVALFFGDVSKLCLVDPYEPITDFYGTDLIR